MVVEAIRIYVLLAATWLRSAAQYPASMAMLLGTQIMATSLDLGGCTGRGSPS